MKSLPACSIIWVGSLCLIFLRADARDAGAAIFALLLFIFSTFLGYIDGRFARH